MKKNVMRFSAIACLLIATFICASCGGGVCLCEEFFFIELHDEKGEVINKKEDLETFTLSIIDSYNGSKFDGKISLGEHQYKDSNVGGYIYELYFHLGTGQFESTARRYERKFKKQMEKTGIRIEDNNGRYKTSEIYPLSGYKDGACIIVKLEKK